MAGQLCGQTAWNSSPQRRNGDGRREGRKGQTDKRERPDKSGADAHQRAKSPSQRGVRYKSTKSPEVAFLSGVFLVYVGVLYSGFA